jgi:hypothetical protein
MDCIHPMSTSSSCWTKYMGSSEGVLYHVSTERNECKTTMEPSTSTTNYNQQEQVQYIIGRKSRHIQRKRIPKVRVQHYRINNNNNGNNRSIRHTIILFSRIEQSQYESCLGGGRERVVAANKHTHTLSLST